jgi:hypothetical protein
MPKVRDILVHVSVEAATRKRKCHRSGGKHDIQAGASCLVVREREGLGHKNYCRDCSVAILVHATARLTELTQALEVRRTDQLDG